MQQGFGNRSSLQVVDLSGGRSVNGAFLETGKCENGSGGGGSNDHGLGTISVPVSLPSLVLCRGKHWYLGAGVTVVEVVVVLGTRRYELQNEVAGPPSTFKTPKTPVRALQFTARGTSAAPAEQEAGGICGAQLTSAAATETSESRSVLSSMMVEELGQLEVQGGKRCRPYLYVHGGRSGLIELCGAARSS